MLRASLKLLRGITILLIICCCSSAWADTKYGGGTGEPNDPYQIWDANDMQAIGADANDWDKHFILMADIDLGQFDGQDGRPEFNAIGIGSPFEGVFDGNGCEIWNHSSTSGRDAGIFGFVDGDEVLIKNLGLRNTYISVQHRQYIGALASVIYDGNIVGCYAVGGSITGWRNVGGLVGRNWGATISDCFTDLVVSVAVDGGAAAGGLVGDSFEGSISHCYARGDVFGHEAGGLIGRIYTGYVYNCYAAGDVNGSVSNSMNIGGLVGEVRDADISYCYSSGDVHGHDDVGGLVGRNGSDRAGVSNCYSTGNVTGYRDTGGLVGRNIGLIRNCFSIGNVSGTDDVGGLVGENYHTIINSYWDIQTSSDPNMCGYQSTGCDPNYGKTTVEMKQQSTFTDWDFINTWNIGENQTYPYLRTVPAGDINKDKTVNFLDLCIIAQQWCNEQ